MKVPQIPPLPGCTPLGVKSKSAWIETSNACHLVGEVPELFDAPFNLRGEVLTSEIDTEGEARVRALAQAEARNAQRVFPLHDDTNENTL